MADSTITNRLVVDLHGQKALDKDAFFALSECLKAAGWAAAQARFGTTMVPLKLNEAEAHLTDAAELLQDAAEAVAALREAVGKVRHLNAQPEGATE